MMYRTVNSLRLYNICPNLLKFDDVHSHFKPVKYNLDLNLIEPDSKDQVQLYLNVLSYKILEEVLIKPNMSRKRIDRFWNGLTNAIDEEYRKLIVAGWVRLLAMIEEVRAILSNYSGLHSNHVYHKSIHRPHPQTFQLKIDGMLMSDKGVDLFTIVPMSYQGDTMNGLSSVDTMFALDYMEEAGIKVGKVIELSYEKGRDFAVKEFYPSKLTKTYMNTVINHMENRKSNPFFCDLCPYKRSCKLRDRV